MKKISNPLVSIIISTRNEASNLENLLISINNQNYKPIEIIVVDNHSQDNTLHIARRFTSYVYTKGHERSEQRNFGIKKAKGEYLLFLDADMELTSTVVSECVEEIKNDKIVAVIIPEDVRITNFFSRMKRIEKQMYWNEPLIEAARFYKKSILLKAGGYNEKMNAGEDWDLSRRISLLGRVSRIETPLFHNETSLVRELKHKLYYARHIQTYAKTQPELYKIQSGTFRITLLFRKFHFIRIDPLAFAGLILLKSTEFIMYRIFLIYNSLHFNIK